MNRPSWLCPGRLLLLAISASLYWASPLSAQPAPDHPTFTPRQLDRIRTLGPWPAPWRPDTSNRASGHSDAIALGRLLFFDARLSGQGTHSCSSCHRPEKAWTDGRPTAAGLAPSRRNTPSLLDVRSRRWFGWDGGHDSLWAQSIRPILDPGEMGASAIHVRAHIAGNPPLAELYARLFGRAAADPTADDVLVDAAKALAAFQETIVSPRTRFDAFHDQLLGSSEAGRPLAETDYSNAARRGLTLFVGRGGCDRCHGGPTFAADRFVRLAPGGRTDHGRAEGLARLRRDPHALGGLYDDRPAVAARPPRPAPRPARPSPADRGAFRVPSLRGVAATAPYMHDGAVATLAEAVAHPVPGRPGRRRDLSAADSADLVAFLETLGP